MRFALFFIHLLLGAINAGATLVIPKDLNTLLKESPLVVYGKIVQIEVNSAGYRTALLEAFEIPRASYEYQKLRDFYIPLLNRAHPRQHFIEKVAGAPELRMGEEVLVFLKPVANEHEGAHRRSDGKTLFALLGFHQGKFRVLKDRQGLRRVASWNVLSEVPLTSKELRQQRTTLRLKNARTQKVLQSELPHLEKLPSLDSILNEARNTPLQGEE